MKYRILIFLTYFVCFLSAHAQILKQVKYWDEKADYKGLTEASVTLNNFNGEDCFCVVVEYPNENWHPGVFKATRGTAFLEKVDKKRTFNGLELSNIRIIKDVTQPTALMIADAGESVFFFGIKPDTENGYKWCGLFFGDSAKEAKKVLEQAINLGVIDQKNTQSKDDEWLWYLFGI